MNSQSPGNKILSWYFSSHSLQKSEPWILDGERIIWRGAPENRSRGLGEGNTEGGKAAGCISRRSKEVCRVSL